jgi:hypothetical protein
VGLGLPQNISTAALQTISGNNGGYLLVTGAIGTDNRFLLQKYFLQILAGVSNAQIVLDPQGALREGRVERVPFQLTSGDTCVDVILLTPETRIVDFRVQTPTGQVIAPWQAQGTPGMRYVQSDGVSYYRLVLPVELTQGRFDGAGTWVALLTIGRPQTQPPGIAVNAVDAQVPSAQVAAAGTRTARLRGAAARRASMLVAERALSLSSAGGRASTAGSLPYSLVVHAWSSLTLRVHASQSGREPGARVTLQAAVAQSGIPLVQGVAVWAEVTSPRGTATNVAFQKDAGGGFSAHFDAAIAGVHAIRVRARGNNLRGQPFTREQTLSAAVWIGGSQGGGGGGGSNGSGGGSNGGGGSGGGVDPCALLKCLLAADGIVSAELEAKLRAAGIDLAVARRCLTAACANGSGGNGGNGGNGNGGCKCGS